MQISADGLVHVASSFVQINQQIKEGQFPETKKKKKVHFTL
jgi:hypothetical protein